MTELFDLIAAEIRAQGPIGVDRYMDMALGHPEHGYYVKQDPFGEAGDFITAPEITQMFGEMLGLWTAAVWQGMGMPDPVNLVELGPGRGTLMADALRAAHTLEDFDDAVRVWLVETSPVLRDAQKKTLAPAMIMPAWRDTFEDVGDGPLIVLANEFFDALPVKQYEFTGDDWRERCIGLNAAGDALTWVAGETPVDPNLIPAAVRDTASEGDVFEDQTASRAVAASIAKRVVAHGGAALIVDYGYVAHGLGDTVQAVKGHEYADVLNAPGDQDLTAHVDFEQLAEAAREAGADVLGPVPQGAFLERLGLRQRADMLMMNATPEQMAEIDGAYTRLTAAEGMGELFKVMAITAPGFGVPPWAE